MASLNQCNFIGNLGRDPESRFTSSGTAVTSFSIACTESWKNKNTGQKEERTEWVNVTAFGKLGEIASQHLREGKQIYVSGKMRTEQYEKEGVTRYSTKIIADKFIMLGGKSSTGSDYAGSNASSRTPQQSPPTSSGGSFEDDPFGDSEIPF